MHIAVLTDGITPYVMGGMQRHSHHLVKFLLAEGADITLVHTIPYTTDLPSETEVQTLFNGHAGNLRVLALPFEKINKFPGHYIKESYRYSCTIAEALMPELDKFDFIYAKGFTAWRLLELKKKRKHFAPVGVKFHGYEMFQRTLSFKGRLEQYMLKPAVVFNARHANAVFSYGGQISEIIASIGVPRSKIIEIPSGVDPKWVSQDCPRHELPRKFVYLGRNERRKGINDLRRALKRVQNRNIEMHWIGPVDAKLADVGIKQVFHGSLSDPQEIMNILDTCDVLIAPSHAEGMPNVILEAMARGLAIIATEVGAVPILLADGNGICIEPGNIRQLTQAIDHFATLSESDLMVFRKRSQIAVNERFNWEKIAKEIIHQIHKITFSVLKNPD